jgi:hypothetical protein
MTAPYATRSLRFTNPLITNLSKGHALNRFVSAMRANFRI